MTLDLVRHVLAWVVGLGLLAYAVTSLLIWRERRKVRRLFKSTGAQFAADLRKLTERGQNSASAAPSSATDLTERRENLEQFPPNPPAAPLPPMPPPKSQKPAGRVTRPVTRTRGLYGPGSSRWH
jgi:hypothetical protein